jgi:hypothetical protein
MRVSFGFSAAALGLVFLATGCGGGGADGIMKDTISTMNEMAAILESIKDEKTADEATPKLDKQIEKLKVCVVESGGKGQGHFRGDEDAGLAAYNSRP